MKREKKKEKDTIYYDTEFVDGTPEDPGHLFFFPLGDACSAPAPERKRKGRKKFASTPCLKEAGLREDVSSIYWNPNFQGGGKRRKKGKEDGDRKALNLPMVAIIDMRRIPDELNRQTGRRWEKRKGKKKRKKRGDADRIDFGRSPLASPFFSTGDAPKKRGGEKGGEKADYSWRRTESASVRVYLPAELRSIILSHHNRERGRGKKNLTQSRTFPMRHESSALANCSRKEGEEGRKKGRGEKRTGDASVHRPNINASASPA